MATIWPARRMEEKNEKISKEDSKFFSDDGNDNPA